MVLQMVGSYVRLVPGEGPHVIVAWMFMLSGTAVLLWGCMRYLKAKGYPRWLGVLGLCTCLGVLIVFLLPNRRTRDGSDVT